jgi:putative membrane protein
MKTTGVLIAMSIAMSAAAGEHGFTDPQIARIVIAANEADIEAGNLAADKSQRADVRELARQIVADHAGANESTLDWAGKLRVVPEESHISQGLRFGSDESLETLKTLEGAAFDEAYIDHEVAFHQHVLEAIDEELIPNASNAELKTLLKRIEPTFAADLERARHLQIALTDRH